MTHSSVDLPKRALVIGGLTAPLAHAEPVRVWLPRYMSTADPQLPYVRDLMLALQRAGSNGDIQLVNLEMHQGRSLMELARGSSPST